MKKVLIEFLDNDNLENIISLLNQKFDKVIYFYHAEKINNLSELKHDLTKFIKRRFLIVPKFVKLEKYNFDDLIKVFSAELSGDYEYVIDITGGSEIFISAVGYFAAKSDYKNIKIHHFEIENGRKILCYPNSAEEKPEFTRNLSVEETIELNNSIVEKNKGKMKYDLTEKGLEKEILRLWNAVKDISKQWNSFCIMCHTSSCHNGKTVIKRICESEKENNIYKTVAPILKKNRLISNEHTEYIDGKKYMAYTLEVPDNAVFLYDKGGTILEMYTYLAAVKSNVFTDVCVGVPVDWDGEVQGINNETTNEIDLLLMAKHIPVYISCKNRMAENNYIYEIRALYDHYCGRYAKTVLVSNADNPDSIKTRASDMGIILIDNINKLSLEEFIRKLTEIVYFHKNDA